MIRVFTAFSGYDSQCLALNRIGVDYELVGWSEIDKFAIQAHNALFPQWADRNYGDICKIDWVQVPDFDLFTYSSPCQDFSQAGKQAGAVKGSGTRSSLLWECERAIQIKRPKYLLFENVAAVASKKFVKLFNSWQLTLEQMGYTNLTQILNAKTHGYPTPVPQNRERIFMVSILNCDQPFYFPDAQPLTQRLVDILEPEVDESFYLSDSRINGLIASMQKEAEKGCGFAFVPKDNTDIGNSIGTLPANRKTDNFIKVAAKLHDGQNGTIFNPNGIAPTISANSFEHNNHVVTPINDQDGCSRTIKRQYQQTSRANLERQEALGATGATDGFRIRKLTPRECFRLMGVSDADIDKIQAAGISKSQQYKMAGNSIVVNCLAAIFRQLFIGNFNKVVQTEIF